MVHRFLGKCLVAMCLAGVGGTWAHAESDAPIAPVVPEVPVVLPRPVLLKAGALVTLRVRQVIPSDNLSAADRMLNSLPPLARGDRVLAEVVSPQSSPPALVGGTVVGIEPPKRFGKPGKVVLELGQLVTYADGRSEPAPWIFDLEDKRFNTRMRRTILLALFAAEGAGVGAGIGAQLSAENRPGYAGLGAGVGLISGIAYASLMRGREATLEPGDIFRVEVGTLTYRPIPAVPQMEVHPAEDPSRKKGHHHP